MPPAPPPAPPIERTEVLLIADSAWPEGDQTVTGARWSIRGLPVAVAERAISLGWAFRRDHTVVQQLLDTQQVMPSGPFHRVAPVDCIDLATVTTRPPGSEASLMAQPAGTVETSGPAVVGTAIASSVS
jgi:hypothetical protein